MDDLRVTLSDHAKRYPLMEPTDVVKLIYQNEFCGGHLITDPEAVMRHLHREYAATEHDPSCPLLENIGNGIFRVNLAALAEDQVEKLGRAFIRSAYAHKGERNRFLEKLELLRVLCVECVFSFDVTALDDYLSAYEKAGYPMVSHSEAYRTAYHPAYRIVTREEYDAILK